MKGIFTSFLVFGSLALTSNSAFATDFISAPMTVSPANETIMGHIGMVDIQWKGVELEVEDSDTSAKNQIDKSMITVVLNGEENTAWRNYMGSEVYVHHIEYSDEQNGGGIYDGGYMLSMYFGDTAFFQWFGTLQITVAEGAVTSTDGAVNPEINLTYYLKKTTEWYDINFSPETNSEFNQGEGEIMVWWNIEGELKFNEENPYSIYAESYDLDEATKNRINLKEYCSVDDNKLIVNISQMAPGDYYLIIPEGTFFIGEDYINLDSVNYHFIILPNGTDSISGIANDINNNNQLFDLQGRPINKDNVKPGIYIIDGKKVVLK